MINEAFSQLLEDPTFGFGMALLGGSHPRNAPLLQAMQMLQANKKSKLEAEYRKAQLEAQREQTRLYGLQVQGQQAKLDLDKQLDTRTQAFMQQLGPLLQQYGIGGPQQQMPQQPPMGMQPPIGDQPPTGAMPSPVQPPQMPMGMQLPPAGQPQPQPMASQPKPSIFPIADSFVERIEGAKAPDGTWYGIDPKAHPQEYANGQRPTPERARQIRSQYWQAINGDSLPQPTALVAYDAAILQGPEYAQELLKKTGGEPVLMQYQRRQDLKKLAETDPTKSQYLKGWQNRLDQLSQFIKTPDGTHPVVNAPGQRKSLQPHQVLGLAAGAMQLGARDLKGASVMADALKPDYEGERVDLQRGQLGIQQEQLDVQRTAERRQADELALKQQKQQQELRETKTKDWRFYAATNDNIDLFDSKISELISHPGLKGVFGPAGQVPDWPGSPAAKARAILSSITSQAALENLTQLRQNSPTGGALGNVSNADIDLTKEGLISLANAQSPEDAVKAMTQLRAHFGKMRERATTAFEKSYGESPINPELPPGSRPTGFTPEGKRIYSAPNGKNYIEE